VHLRRAHPNLEEQRMIRIGKGIAGTLSAVALVLGASVASHAQTTSQPSDTTKGTTAQPDTSRTEPSHKETPSKGATSRQAPSTKESAQERFDREKVTLKDRVEEQVTLADANIDALKKMKDSDKGAAQKRDEEMEKKISDLKDHLQKDVDKIDKATPSDWAGVHPVVQRDLTAMEAELKTAEKLTKVPAPHTGAANKQPSNPEPSHPAPAPAEKH
jgi:hypothetical protein